MWHVRVNAGKVIQSWLSSYEAVGFGFVPFLQRCSRVYESSHTCIFTPTVQMNRGWLIFPRFSCLTCSGGELLRINNNSNNRFMTLCPGLPALTLCLGLPAWAGTRRNIHPPTILIIIQFFISFFHLLRSIASSLFKLCAWQSFLHNLLGISSTVFFCGPDVLPVTQQCQSIEGNTKHWPQLAWSRPFFVHRQTPDGTGIASFTLSPAFWCQYQLGVIGGTWKGIWP